MEIEMDQNPINEDVKGVMEHLLQSVEDFHKEKDPKDPIINTNATKQRYIFIH